MKAVRKGAKTPKKRAKNVMRNMSKDDMKRVNKYLRKEYKKEADLKIEEMVWERISTMMVKWKKEKQRDEIRSEFHWIAEPQIEKFAAEKELLSGLPYEIYATEEEADGFRLQWDGDFYEYSKHRWFDKEGNVYVNEIQTLLDNLFDANFKSIKERVEEAALDLVAAKYYGEKQYFLVLDDFYKNENKKLLKKVHDENIEKIIRKVLEI